MSALGNCVKGERYSCREVAATRNGGGGTAQVKVGP